MNRTPVLYLNVFLIATCGLVYELLAGTLASYVLGDSVTQFSLIIGIYLSALGVGAWLSGFIDKGLARAFIEVELGVALLGGLSAPLLFLSFARLPYFHVMLYGIVFAIGVLVGLELPLLMRIAKDQFDFKDLISRLLAFDYVGALVASLLFPLVFVQHLGLMNTSLLIGMVNALVGLWGTWLLRPLIVGSVLGLRVRAVLVLLVLSAGVAEAKWLMRWTDDGLFANRVIYTETTPYQRIVVTTGRGGFQLFLNGHMQFNSTDEYRYHEALVHPAMMAAASPRRVLVLGGGDGLALRELLKYRSVESATLVDIDPAMPALSRKLEMLAQLNANAYDDPRVRVISQDALIWLEEPGEAFDVVVIDFPDPNTYAVGKLYTTRFYRLLKQRLTKQGVVSIQCSSPLVAPKTFWCIIRTMEAAGFTVKPYHTAVPSFMSVWGFGLARLEKFEVPRSVPEGVELRFLNNSVMPSLFELSADLQPVPVEINRLDNQPLVHYHETEWKRLE